MSVEDISKSRTFRSATEVGQAAAAAAAAAKAQAQAQAEAEAEAARRAKEAEEAEAARRAKEATAENLEYQKKDKKRMDDLASTLADEMGMSPREKALAALELKLGKRGSQEAGGGSYRKSRRRTVKRKKNTRRRTVKRKKNTRRRTKRR